MKNQMESKNQRIKESNGTKFVEMTFITHRGT
jgi:hypothetical protein